MKHTISILVENHAGVLSRISGLFSRRGFNIDSLAVGETDDPKVSRVTIVADGDVLLSFAVAVGCGSLCVCGLYCQKDWENLKGIIFE